MLNNVVGGLSSGTIKLKSKTSGITPANKVSLISTALKRTLMDWNTVNLCELKAIYCLNNQYNEFNESFQLKKLWVLDFR